MAKILRDVKMFKGEKTMKSKLIILGFICAAAHADEGMWMPQQLPEIAGQMKAAGLKLDPGSLTKLTEFPMGAIVSLGGCSASFVSPQGLVATNHHCIYRSLTHNSTPKSDLVTNGFLAKSLGEELAAPPGSRILVTKDVSNVTSQIISSDVVSLVGKKRYDGIEKNQKALVASCEKDPGHRCTVASFYGGLEYYLIKQLEIRDVRLVHAAPGGVGMFGGETDNWMWPRHTGDYGFLRGYVSKDGKAADFSKENVPYQPKFFLKLAKEGAKEGDFVMALGYPGRTNRHRLPSEIAFTFGWGYPQFLTNTQEALSIIDRETKNFPDAKIKYAGQVAGYNNYYKNRKGMLASYEGSDLLARKTNEHDALKAWINAKADRKAEFSGDIEQIEKLLLERDNITKRDQYLTLSYPNLLGSARTLYRLANESTKPDADRKAGFQARDLVRQKEAVAALERTYDEKVDKALVLNFLSKYAAQPKAERNAAFDAAVGIKEGMTSAELKTHLDTLYAGSKLANLAERSKWLQAKPEEFKTSSDSFIKLAVALYEEDLRRESEDEELSGKIQQAYSKYMKAKLAYMNSLGQPVYPDANGTLRVTFGRIAGRAKGGADGKPWNAFTTVEEIVAKATGEGEFNAPANQLAAIKAKDFGNYVDAKLKTVPVDFLATLDITGGNSGSAALNANAELIGLAFDGTLDSIISDWDFNTENTRSIQVDLRYMLWQMRHVDKADNLIKELGVN